MAARQGCGWLAVLLLVSGVARGEEWREVPYKDLAQLQVMLAKVDTEHVFATRFKVESSVPGKSLPADLRIEVLVDGKAHPVRVDPDGNMALPARQDWLDADAKIRVNQPKGTLKVSYEYKARTPPGKEMSYARLTESLQVMERGIKEAAGWMRFLAPEPYALRIIFPVSAAPMELVLSFPDGSSKRYRAKAPADDKATYQEIELPWNPEWRQARAIFNTAPGAVFPLMK